MGESCEERSNVRGAWCVRFYPFTRMHPGEAIYSEVHGGKNVGAKQLVAMWM